MSCRICNFRGFWYASFIIIGGQVGIDSVASDEVYQLDIEGEQWNHVGKIETARFGHAAVATDNGFVVFGGDR